MSATMQPRYEAVQFRPAEIPTPVEGQQYDLRLWPGTVGYAVLDHEAREVVALDGRPSLVMKRTRYLNEQDWGTRTQIPMLGTAYYNQLKKWSARRDTPAH